MEARPAAVGCAILPMHAGTAHVNRSIWEAAKLAVVLAFVTNASPTAAAENAATIRLVVYRAATVQAMPSARQAGSAARRIALAGNAEPIPRAEQPAGRVVAAQPAPLMGSAARQIAPAENVAWIRHAACRVDPAQETTSAPLWPAGTAYREASLRHRMLIPFPVDTRNPASTILVRSSKPPDDDLGLDTDQGSGPRSPNLRHEDPPVLRTVPAISGVGGDVQAVLAGDGLFAPGDPRHALDAEDDRTVGAAGRRVEHRRAAHGHPLGAPRI